ncbi:MAG: acyltransferase [Armatimonas sp.]
MNDIQKQPVSDDARAAWVTRGRIPYLDGFRALAIVSVVLSHLRPQLPYPNVTIPVIANGHIGVTLFFVISGFLITLLLLREHERSGTVSIKNFYIRRVFRIFPAYFFYLGIFFVLQLLRYIHIESKYWIASLFYAMCYMPNLNSAWEIAHTWSLSVEEHFYFLWPALFLWLKPQRALRVLLVYLVCIPLIRYAVWRFLGHRMDIDFASITQMGSIATGCVLAFMANRSIFPSALERVQKAPVLFFSLGTVVLFVSDVLARSGKYNILFHDPVSAVCFGVILLSVLCMTTQLSGLRRFLDAKPVVFIGLMSYSIYLWQEPFTSKGVFAQHLPHWTIHVSFILLTALFSYWCIEKPFLRIKEKRYSNA